MRLIDLLYYLVLGGFSTSSLNRVGRLYHSGIVHIPIKLNVGFSSHSTLIFWSDSGHVLVNRIDVFEPSDCYQYQLV